MTTETLEQPSGLLARWETLRGEEPKIRIREAAHKLGVTEAQLLAASTDGRRVLRLQPKFREIIAEIPSLGRVMALTRNESVVHERKGAYEKVDTSGHAGLVLGPDIDLRMFFGEWAFGFALVEEDEKGAKRSLQFFDARGNAVHKIFAQDATDLAAFTAIVERYRAEDQGTDLEVKPANAPAPLKADADIDAAGFRAAWDAMKDTHEFFGMLRKFGTGRTQALRLAGPERAVKLSNDATRAVLETASAREVPVMVFVGNPGNIQIHTGPVKNIKVMGPWLNVLDPDFNLHLREDRVAESWLVRKPTADGVVTSLELFDEDGENIALIFGKRKPGIPEDKAWKALIEEVGAAKA
jgi:putative hemin transport protein